MQSLIQPINPEQIQPALVIFGLFVIVLLIAGLICDVIAFRHVRRNSAPLADLTARLQTRRWTLNDVGILMLALAGL
jgi:hypothetical protein